MELLVSVTLSLLLMAGVLRMFAAASADATTNSQLSEYQSNGRYALDLLQREIRHASLRPMIWTDAQLAVDPDAAAADFGCGAGVATAIVEGLRVSDNLNPYATSCLRKGPDREYARGDVVTLRRLGLDAVTVVDAGAPYARVSYGAGTVFLGGTALGPANGPTFQYPVVSDVYFINRFSDAGPVTPNAPAVPGLYRLRLSPGPAPTMTPELIAPNVEHMRLQFILGDGGDGRQVVPASSVPDWSRVSAVRIWLLLRATAPETGLTAAQSHVLGDVTYIARDGYRRTVMSTTVYLRAR